MIVKVPASTANLGPGFDCLGIALKLYNRIAFEKSDRLLITGCDARYCGADNLAFAGYRAAMKARGLTAEGARIDFRETCIPVSRGLGSSAALISAGAFAANELHGLHLSREELLSVCTRIEGHPDNLAPMIYGGFTAAAIDGEEAICASYPLSPALRFLAVIPDTPLSTAKARQALPETVSRADAVFQLSRTALLIDALGRGDMELLGHAIKDHLHQPYRLPLIPGAEKVFALAEKLGGGRACACISGAGSTLLLISDSDAVIRACSKAVLENFPTWKALTLEPDTEGITLPLSD